MPVQQIELTEQERLALQAVADLMGMSVEDAASLLAKDGLARRLKPAPRFTVISGRKSA